MNKDNICYIEDIIKNKNSETKETKETNQINDEDEIFKKVIIQN